MVKAFASQGHRVHGCARSKDAIERIAKEFHPPNRFEQVDVRDGEQVQNWADRILATASAPDLLINNAALINRNAMLWEVPIEEFADVINVNILGMFHVIRSFVPAMIENRSGVIVNFSSGWGRSTSAEVAPYCATKWAVEGLTRSLAAELPDGMAAVPVNPGIIDTEVLQSCFGDAAAHYPTPDEWSQEAVPFLLQLDGKDNGQPLSIPR
jgi:NAD(P)-dependent dehydrogenase (short-subunit alcohol dehydrogenase family)